MRLNVGNSANLLDLARRQTFWLLKRYRQDGVPAIQHKARGRALCYRIDTTVQENYIASRKKRRLFIVLMSNLVDWRSLLSHHNPMIFYFI